MKHQAKIYAVIVTFNPDIESLRKNLCSISEQVDRVVIIDNSNNLVCQNRLQVMISENENITLIQLNENKGIAYAQNIGFVYSLKAHADFVITFDQDSSVENGLVQSLYEEYLKVKDENDIKIACIGPSVINDRNKQEYENYFHNSVKINESVYSVNFIISSGTLYETDAFVAIGLNKAEWFIDSIDIEWCYRVRYLGYQVLMTTKATMKHNLGARDIQLPLGRLFNIGAPFRHYYVYRNWIFSLREPHFDYGYKFKLVFMMPIKFIICAAIPPRKKRILFMLKGIRDGILKRHSFIN